MKCILIFVLALILPACGGDSSGGGARPGGVANPDQITVSVDNADTAPYYLAIQEFVNGVLSAEVRICWPIPGRTTPAPTHQEGVVNFHADGAVYTHAIILYSTPAGAVSDSEPFVKGAWQLLLVVTINAGQMTVQPT